MADNDHYVESRRFGEATVTLINDGSGQSTIVKQLTVPEAEWRRAAPEASARGELILNYQAAHVAIGGASILIDFGFDDPSEQSQWKEPRHHRTPGVQAGLASIGVQPEDVSHVLITHAHGDHFAGAAVDGRPRFPKATVLLGRADWEGNPQRSAGDDSLFGRNLGAIERAGLLKLVDGEHEVVPGVTMLHAPGESPGHSIVRVRSGGQSFYFLGDLFHHPCEVVNLDWVSGGRDAAAMRASRERLLAEAVPIGATLVYTHSLFPGWGTIVREGDRYRWVGAEPVAPLVGILMGSDSDWPTMQAAAEVLREYEVPFEARVLSAHRTPERMAEYAQQAHERGLKVLIAGASGAAHLPGMVASYTPLPVVGVPVPLGHLQGIDALLSIVQMPRGIPVATVAIGNAQNAGLLAVRILAAHDSGLQARLLAARARRVETVVESDARLQREVEATS